jgi:hypothetical protein
MRLRKLIVLIVLAASVLVLVASGGSLQAESPRRSPSPSAPSIAAWHPGVEVAKGLTALRVAHDLEIERFNAGMRALLDDVAQFVASIPPPFPSEAWFREISLCESGGENGWRTGYFGIEAGYPIGHMGYEEQLAWAREIYGRAGDGAWGCTHSVGPAY